MAGLDDPAWGGLHIVASLCRSAIARVVEHCSNPALRREEWAGLDDPAWGGLHMVASLCRSAIALVVERVRTQPCGGNYGQGWIRTSEGVSQQIYSLPRLATPEPTRN